MRLGNVGALRRPVRGLVAASLLLGLAPTGGSAADLGSGTYRYAPPAGYDFDWWSGFYLGATAGYGTGGTRVHGNIGRFSHDQNGALAGLLGGYNWKRDRFVLGLEGEAKGAWVSGSAIAGGLGFDQSMRWMGTVRGRAGVLLAPALLVYGLAGVSTADIRFEGAVVGGRHDDFFVGLQVGGGAEVKLTDRWSLRADYTYTNFAGEKVGPPGASNSFDPTVHAVQAAVTYRF